jgi:hypothetical protein
MSTLAYLAPSSATKEKSFMKLAPGVLRFQLLKKWVLLLWWQVKLLQLGLVLGLELPKQWILFNIGKTNLNILLFLESMLKNLFSSSLTRRQNNLECLYLTSFSGLV